MIFGVYCPNYGFIFRIFQNHCSFIHFDPKYMFGQNLVRIRFKQLQNKGKSWKNLYKNLLNSHVYLGGMGFTPNVDKPGLIFVMNKKKCCNRFYGTLKKLILGGFCGETVS